MAGPLDVLKLRKLAKYVDPASGKLKDWAWKPLVDVRKEIPITEVPDYVQAGYGNFMSEMAKKAAANQLSQRDLLKAYLITQSSIGRGGLSHATATKNGLKVPKADEIRPEGAFATWLGSPAGQRYLTAADRGEIDQKALEDIRQKFAPFGKQNQLVDTMADAVTTIPAMYPELNAAIAGGANEYRDFAEQLKGIAASKSGFIGSLLGRGDLPTFDARQIGLHTSGMPMPTATPSSILSRGKGQGGREAVDRLAARQEAMQLGIDPSLDPYYQHLSHHAIWDAVGGEKTTHQDLIDAMKNYSEGGPVHMQVGGLSKIPSLVRRVGEAASKAKPFYSAVDEAIAKITQGKGTGEQFLSMIKKTPGVKPKEIKDRGLDKLLTGKMTKAEVEKIAADNPPPQIFETTKRGPEEGNKYRAEYDDNSQRWEVMDDYSMPVARFDDEEDAIERAAKLNDSGTAKFADTEYVTKGGTNHREILFRMPSDVPGKESAMRSWHEQMKQKYKTIGWKELATTEEVSKNNALVAALKKDQNAFKSQHYDELNILAHARVSDRIGPNGEKILHVDEIQSDLHQKARDARKKEIKRLVNNGMTEDDAKKAVPSDFGYSGNIKELPEGYKLEEFISPSGGRAYRVNDPQGTLYSSGMSPESATKNAIENLNVGVPDAPFKSDWHELVMKRLLDDAARNGYDRVTITPGAEQAKRYNLSKQVDQITARRLGDKYYLNVTGKNGETIYNGRYSQRITADEMERIIGKEMTQKIVNNTAPESENRAIHVFNGLDLQVGGEGMIGFYDQMLPAFVNRYGEKTGLRMNLGDTPVDGKKYKVYEDNNPLPFSIVPEDGFTIAGRYATQEEADTAALARATQPFHSIDITPEFRESVTEKGQPFYQIGAGSAIGAAAASEEEPKQSGNIATFRIGGEVNLDAMRMAVTNKQLRKRHG